MNFKCLVFSLLTLVSFGLFGMNAPKKTTESHKRKQEMTQEDILQFLQNMKQNNTTVENSFMRLLTPLESKEKHNFVNELEKLALQDYTRKIEFLQILRTKPVTRKQPAKKKQKIEPTEKQVQIEAENSDTQSKNQSQELHRLMIQTFTHIKDYQMGVSSGLKNNVDLIENVLQVLEGSNPLLEGSNPPKKDNRPPSHSLLYS